MTSTHGIYSRLQSQQTFSNSIFVQRALLPRCFPVSETLLSSIIFNATTPVFCIYEVILRRVQFSRTATRAQTVPYSHSRCLQASIEVQGGEAPFKTSMLPKRGDTTDFDLRCHSQVPASDSQDQLVMLQCWDPVAAATRPVIHEPTWSLQSAVRELAAVE